MSRLVNPGLGDQIDRLTILSLKILYGTLAARPVEHFENERNALLVQVRARNNGASWYEHGLALHAVNAALWAAEDELREYRRCCCTPDSLRNAATKTLQDVVACAFRIQDLNDRRSEIIRTINALVGEDLGKEKLS